MMNDDQHTTTELMNRLEPRTAIHIRLARSDDDVDFRFIDGLQKAHSHAVGFMHRKTIEANIADGHVLIAESPPACVPETGRPIPGIRGNPLGYIIGRDRYFKREDVGIIYQLNVKPTTRRSLIGAMLVQAMFERAAYGCKLFCCWCAQDLDANYFWEAIGFVPLAFRTGSERQQRIHIFWQKRIREGDVDTPYWFPSMTAGGAIREGRLVIPVPPGTHWKDAKPMVLPGVNPFVEESEGARRALPGAGVDPDEDAPLAQKQKKKKNERKKRRRQRLTEAQKRASRKGGLWFAEAPATDAGDDETQSNAEDERGNAERVKRTYHPKYVAAARELCARYLDELQTEDGRHLLSTDAGKYNITRSLEGAESQFRLNAGNEEEDRNGGSDDDRPTIHDESRKLLDAA